MELSRSIVAIIGFVMVYFLLFALSIGLVAATVKADYSIIIALPRLITIALGIGLMGFGVMVFVFLVKFILHKHKQMSQIVSLLLKLVHFIMTRCI